MAQTRRLKTGTQDRISITISIKARDEKTARRILEHPALKKLIEAFEEKRSLGGQDRQAENPFADKTKDDFLGDVHLRSRAVKWMADQALMEDGSPEKIIRGACSDPDSLDTRLFRLVVDDMPELAVAYHHITAGLAPYLEENQDKAVRKMKDKLGYGDYEDGQIMEHLRALMIIAEEEGITENEYGMLRDLICIWEGRRFGGVL